MLMTGMIRPAIAAIMFFDVMLLINGVYYMICGIRNRSKRYGRWMLIAAGAASRFELIARLQGKE